MMIGERPMRFRVLREQTRPRPRWSRALCGAALTILAGCVGGGSQEDAAAAAVPKPVPVRMAPAEVTTLRPSVDLVGTLVAMPERTAAVTAQTDGRIENVAVVEGAVVNPGETIVRLDARPAGAQQQRAEAVVGQQQAALNRLRHGYLPQEIEMARQESRKAKAELDILRRRVDAMAQLHSNNEVSDVEFERLKSTLRRAEAVFAASSAKLDLYEVGTRPETIAEAESQLQTANADLTRARLAVEFCTISSPIAGVVTSLTARRGDTVASSDKLATVVDLSHVFVRVRIPSAYLSEVNPGARVEAVLPSLPDRKIEGHIARFSGEADPTTGDIQAFAVLANDGGRLRPGLGCRVRVWLPAIENALVVPVSAVADRAGTPVLHVVREGRAYEVQVSIGADARGYVQITDGLSPGDVVITEGGYGLPDRCPVTATSP